jgi:hypothetical protein
MFSPKDKSDFTRSERVLGDVKSGQARRGQYGRGQQFIRYVAQEGVDQPAFTNIGRWRVDDASSQGGEVHVPWLTVDIDNVDLMEAYQDACRTLDRLAEIGYDMDRVVCSFSGGKGFHVQVDAEQMGLAPFKGPQHARIFLRAWTRSVCMGDYYDSSVCTPRSLIRLTGSRHGKTDLHKRSFFAPTFQDRGMHGVMQNVRDDYEGFEWPAKGEVLPGPRKHLRKLYERAESQYRGRRSSGAFSSSAKKSGGVVSSIKYGIREGQDFGPRSFHVGRENAAFIMGCKLIEECKNLRVAKEKLQQWNGLNTPPLAYARLEAQWRGAKRKMNKSRR